MIRRGGMVAGALGIGFMSAGALHLIHPEPFVRIVPGWLPHASLLVTISGVAELLGGAGLLVPALRRPAGVGLLLLLAAVFPANIEMVVHPDQAGAGLPSWMLWARLPLQPALALLVWFVAVRRAQPRPRS